MAVRLAYYLSGFLSWGAIVLILSGISPHLFSGGRSLYQDISSPGLSSPLFIQSIGTPLSDKEIKLRGKGGKGHPGKKNEVYPVEVQPGVVVDKSGPVKLWDEVSIDGREESPPPVVPERSESP